MSNQTLEGWGTSLSWFANSVGGWTNTTNQNNLMNAVEDYAWHTGNGATVDQWVDNGGANQHWNLVLSQ